MGIEEYWAMFVTFCFILYQVRKVMIIRKLKKADKEERENQENKVKPDED